MIDRAIRSVFLIAFAGAALAALPARAQSPHTHEHSFGGAEKWAKVFDDPERDAWQKPHEVIQALALKPDSVIADIGSGTGYFSMRFAHMVPNGKVYGVDIEPDMVKYLAERAKREGLENVTAIAGAPGDPRLPEKADLIILVDVYHHVEKSGKLFPQAARFAQARWPGSGHRLPHGIAGRPAESRANRAGKGEIRTQASRLRAGPGARFSAEPVFPRLPSELIWVNR
jgi:cyclopropane fatty-acyl-phospholipid synthase-like methyltransferase